MAVGDQGGVDGGNRHGHQSHAAVEEGAREPPDQRDQGDAQRHGDRYQGRQKGADLRIGLRRIQLM